MRKVSLLFLITLVFFSVSVCPAQGSKQPRRTAVSKPKPKPTPTPKAEDLSIISTADAEPIAEPEPVKKTPKRNPQPQSEQEYMRETMNGLTSEMGSLSERVGQMEEKQKLLINLQILSQAEARAETAHQRLFDTVSKESDLKGRLAQLEYESRSEIIERSMSIIGSTRPEDLREMRRQQLNAEKQRIQEQLAMIQQNRTRLEGEVANADLLVERLRRALEESLDNPQPRQPTRKTKEKTDTDNPEKIDPDKPNE